MGYFLIATWVAACAALASAMLVAVQSGREMWRGHVRRRTVNARIEAIAYQLRRMLRSWVGRTDRDDFESWIRQAQNLGNLAQHLDRAEQRMNKLMALRPDAWSQVGRALERANVYFLEGTRRLDEYITPGSPDTDNAVQMAQLRADSEQDLRDCISELEQYVLRRTLVIEGELLARRRLGKNSHEPTHPRARG
jgi:hypothetical protein